MQLLRNFDIHVSIRSSFFFLIFVVLETFFINPLTLAYRVQVWKDFDGGQAEVHVNRGTFITRKREAVNITDKDSH